MERMFQMAMGCEPRRPEAYCRTPERHEAQQTAADEDSEHAAGRPTNEMDTERGLYDHDGRE